MPKLSKSRKIHNKRRSRKTASKRKLRGGSGCGKPSGMYGGSGMSSLPAFSWPASNQHVELNSYNVDTSRTPIVGSERLLGDPNGPMRGGKRSRKMRGGYSFLNNDPVSSFGTTEGASSAAALFSGRGNLVSTNSYDQPIQSVQHNYTSRPLV